jgi:hypothetical protein
MLSMHIVNVESNENHDLGLCALCFCLRRHVLCGVPGSRSQMRQRAEDEARSRHCIVPKIRTKLVHKYLCL